MSQRPSAALCKSLGLAITFVVLAIGLLGNSICFGQQRYELRAEELGIVSRASIDSNQLQIVAQDGTLTVYVRNRKYDSSDGLWLGYADAGTRQVIRWPATNAGNMQIGQLTGGIVKFRYSKMAVRDIPGTTNSRVMRRPQITTDVLPPVNSGSQLATGNIRRGLPAVFKSSQVFQSLGNAQASRQRTANELVQLVGYDVGGSPWVLTPGTAQQLSCTSAQAYNLSSPVGWSVVAASPGLVRIQTLHRGKVFAVSQALRRNASYQLQLAPVSQDAKQLWRLGRQGQRGWMLQSAFDPGLCLTHVGNGVLGLQPMTFAVNQFWSPYVVPFPTPIQPFWRTVSTNVVANAALADARLQLKNNHRDALILLLANQGSAAAPKKIRVEPGASKLIRLKRDPGATVVETVELRSSTGLWESRQLVTNIPPTALYDLSVYTEHLQSIAIDRTGKSPNMVEDVNYVPKSVGWFLLPAGAELPANGSLDVYREAIEADNPGAVRRLNFEEYDDPPEPRPLEALLKDAREQDAKKKSPPTQRRRF